MDHKHTEGDYDIKCSFWNMLADGLSYGEFISNVFLQKTIPC